MSITAIQWAWTRQGCSPGAKLLLLALADHCNGSNNGCECWPSLARLAEMTGLSKASVCKYADELERLGHIRRDRSKGRASTVYRMVQLSAARTVSDPPLSATQTVQDPQLSATQTVEDHQLSATQTVQDFQLSATQTVTVCHTDSNCPPHGQEPVIEPVIESVKQKRESTREKSPSAKTALGSRLTLATLPPDWATWARTERPDLDPTRIWAIFADYWTAKPGAGGCKADWFATWRNWIRREPALTNDRATGGPRDAAAPTPVAKDYTRGATRPEDLPDWARDCAGTG